MAKILLIGRGPLPGPSVPQLGFSQLRTHAFFEALVEAGHSVRLVLLVASGAAKIPDEWAGTVTVTEEGPGWIEQTRDAAAGADCIVSAGPYNPGRLAAAAAGETPLWADIPGDPIAELSALARATSGNLSQAQIATAHAGAAAVLSRADAISVISDPQRFATLGQLAWIGRTLDPSAEPPVHSLPITARFDFPGRAPRTQGSDPLVIALSGAFNPWVDVDGLIATLAQVFEDRADLRVVCTGGGIAGFYEDGYHRFAAWAAQHPDRIALHGWLPHEQMLNVLSQAHAGISMDAAGPEPELGSRTRLLLFAHLGLMPVSTVRCELAQHWADTGALIPLPFQDATGAAETLSSLHVQPEVTGRAQEHCRSLQSLEHVLSPLLQWCEAPRRTGAAHAPQAILAAELESQRDELTRVYSSPTWLALNRLHGLGQTLSRLKSPPE